MLYALTITKLIRDNFEVDTKVIEGLLDYLYTSGYETGYIGWELTRHQPHLLHIHTTISGSKMPYMLKYANYKKTHSLNTDVKKLKTAQDVEKWVSYCHKYKGCIHDAYEDSMMPTIFKTTKLNKNMTI